MAKGDFTHTIKEYNFGPADPGGNRMKIVKGTINATGNYDATAGIALDLSDFFNTIDSVFVMPYGGYVILYDKANDKFVLYYADYDAVADGALIEVPDDVNIVAAITDVPFVAFGE